MSPRPGRITDVVEVDARAEPRRRRARVDGVLPKTSPTRARVGRLLHRRHGGPRGAAQGQRSDDRRRGSPPSLRAGRSAAGGVRHRRAAALGAAGDRLGHRRRSCCLRRRDRRAGRRLLLDDPRHGGRDQRRTPWSDSSSGSCSGVGLARSPRGRGSLGAGGPAGQRGRGACRSSHWRRCSTRCSARPPSCRAGWWWPSWSSSRCSSQHARGLAQVDPVHHDLMTALAATPTQFSRYGPPARRRARTSSPASAWPSPAW